MNTVHRSHAFLAEGIALGLVATGAISVACAALVATIRKAFELFGGEATVPMPVTGGEVASLEGVATVTSAQYTTADVVLSSLPPDVSWMLFLEGALPALATIGVCIIAWWLGVAMMRARPFRRALPAAIGAVAALVVAGGLLGQVFGAIGLAALVESLTASDPAVAETFPAFSMVLDLAPLGWGFALALVAGAFAIGTRLQRDAEGLV